LKMKPVLGVYAGSPATSSPSAELTRSWQGWSRLLWGFSVEQSYLLHWTPEPLRGRRSPVTRH
jgi:hypothetical protein